MGLFNRQKNDTKAVPPEVKQYYASEHRERVGLAWLIAFLSLIVTVAVIAGLFFGGRWTYRKITHKNPTPSVGVGVSNLPKPGTTSSPDSKPSNLQPTAKPPTSGGKISTPEPSSTPKSTAKTTPTTDNSASTSQTSQPSSTTITNTGAGSTITIFIAVSILATLAHLQYQRRRLAKSLTL
ncbi:MAG: hypothetical protein ACXWLH_03395 [Candidatus Saccharimonadales bacterium]